MSSEMDEMDVEDFFDHEPSKSEKQEMRKASKTPSEWLKLLCSEWADENAAVVEATDQKFLEYKGFLKGMLSAHLLCRLSIPPAKENSGLEPAQPTVDFWGILGVEDEFDKAYIVAQVERFAALYSIRAGPLDDAVEMFGADSLDPATAAAAAAAGISVTGGGIWGMDTSAAVAAAAAAAAGELSPGKQLSKKQAAEVSKAHRIAKDAERALASPMKKDGGQRREPRSRDTAIKRAADRAARDATREERRRKKIELRAQREKYTEQQKQAAMKRAAELVQSNRVPIELTRGVVAAKPAPAAPKTDSDEPPTRKRRSAIVVTTAGDLDQIVTHAKNLWKKYNQIAREHNQKVSWVTVARELGIHVKVREKYSRMHSRATQRGFDFQKNAHWKIKDHPEIFVDPTEREQKSKVLPPPDPSTTVLIGEDKGDDDDVVAAAAAVVDHSVVGEVADPTTGYGEGSPEAV